MLSVSSFSESMAATRPARAGQEILLTAVSVALLKGCQAQLEPTAESVLLMLFPAVWTFWPWELACS